MAKLKSKVPRSGQIEAKEKGIKELKETKVKELKGKNNLVGRVKKVIKKSRRRLTEEKFEKELQRTIEFLAQLRTKLDASEMAGENGKDKEITRIETKPQPGGGGIKTEKKAAQTNQNKSRPPKKGLKKAARAEKNRKSLKVEEAAD